MTFEKRKGLLSIEDLRAARNGETDKGVIALKKPQFLSKAKRDELRQAQVLEQEQEQRKRIELQGIKRNRSVQQQDDIEEEETMPLKSSRNRPGTASATAGPAKQRKFNFEWREDEDTNDGEIESWIIKKPGQKQTGTTLRQAKPSVSTRHWSEKELSQMTDRDWRILKEDYQIVFKKNQQLSKPPMRFWEEASSESRGDNDQIPRSLITHITKNLKFQTPTAIQRATIPTALSQRDVIGIAETGSGKTLAFIIPILCHILQRPRLSDRNRDQGPYVLVLAPTRELVLQIHHEFEKFYHWNQGQGQGLGEPLFRCCNIIGGHSFEEIIYNLGHGCEVVVATPGRLLDCLDRKILVLNQCRYLVMDEADRMIDLGFELQMQKILSQLPGVLERSTMMFTATMSEQISNLTMAYMNEPVVVTIGGAAESHNKGLSVVASVRQEVELMKDERSKMTRLLDLLEMYDGPIIVFVNYKKTAQEIFNKISKAMPQIKVVQIHGSKSQDQREDAISRVNSGKADVLIATDVAGRGIDIANVTLVVNYQMSNKIEEYMHRIGRTGRAGKKGLAITLLEENNTNNNEDTFKTYVELQKVVKRQQYISKTNEAFLKKNYGNGTGTGIGSQNIIY